MIPRSRSSIEVLEYQQHLKGLIISHMVSSIPAYNEYAKKVLQPEMVQAALDEILKMEREGRTEDPRYMELLTEQYSTKHLLRMPPDQWLDGVLRTFAHVNHTIYVTVQRPSEMGASGCLEHWDRSGDL